MKNSWMQIAMRAGRKGLRRRVFLRCEIEITGPNVQLVDCSRVLKKKLAAFCPWEMLTKLGGEHRLCGIDGVTPAAWEGNSCTSRDDVHPVHEDFTLF